MSIHMIIYVSNIITIGSVIVVMITIGSRIRYLREQKNLSMKALAAHITETTGIKVSSGKSVTGKTVTRIPLQMA